MTGKSAYVRLNVVWLIVLFAVGVVLGMYAHQRAVVNGGDECRLCEQVKWPRYTVCKDCFDRIPEDPMPVLDEEAAKKCVGLSPDPDTFR